MAGLELSEIYLDKRREGWRYPNSHWFPLSSPSHLNLHRHFLTKRKNFSQKLIRKMAAAVASMAMLNAKPLPITNTNSPKNKLPAAVKPASPKVISLEAAKQGLSASSALAGAMFATIVASEPALAAQQIAEIADGDSRGTALLLPIIPALAWVLFNILQPALNQLNGMRETKGVVVGLGLGGIGVLAAAEHAHASVSEVFGAIAADAPQSDSRGQLLLIVVTPALLWVAYNILRPALNQLDRMRSK